MGANRFFLAFLGKKGGDHFEKTIHTGCRREEVMGKKNHTARPSWSDAQRS